MGQSGSGGFASATIRCRDVICCYARALLRNLQDERREKNLANVERLLVTVLMFDREDALVAGQIRAQLRKAGMPIGPYDVLIAGQALRHKLTLVTANLREFERVPGLRCEDWSG